MIVGIHHATFLSSDLARSRSFYEGILGLHQDVSRPELSFDGVWYDVAAHQQIHLMVLPNPAVDAVLPEYGGQDRHVALQVSDMAVLIRRLEAGGIAYRMSGSGRRALFCRDPDMNTLEFIG